MNRALQVPDDRNMRIGRAISPVHFHDIKTREWIFRFAVAGTSGALRFFHSHDAAYDFAAQVEAVRT